ncbi:Asp23/Gls24 family envelope stress response protein [Kibdelosporangium phytohabitans]|uniref:Stress protein, Gls24 family n=1 Tax=Kibdelosporangium phytohabitans TaxID=860235 RepID=A0A0N9HNZ9_9PSEU|nr:Asp23/Gls24 family envelope stress response protein [Kibdelosporangium phytohabitans]ALG06046.1 stress protein, Gls24 family [Kibdelosporangium phytohabitans]MBE1465876.1 putative alkaline shock family protein YloU [Kibdelosporangium phytohabitans]
MTNSTAEKTTPGQKTQGSEPGNALAKRSGGLVTEDGSTTIADVVVQKIAGLATREVNGVHALGGGTARMLGAIRDRIPGASASVGQGVSVEVGEKQAAVDLEIVVEYGVPISDLAKTVRRNVITAIEQITGLEVVEVNINVNDINLPGEDEDGEPETSRVQ